MSVTAEDIKARVAIAKQREQLKQRIPQQQEIDIDQAPQQEQTVGEFAEGAGQSLLQGATLGFSDEVQAVIAAAVASPFVSDKTFSQLMVDARQSLRQEQDQFREENPATAFGLELAGGAITGGAGLTRSAAKQTLGRTIAKGAATGAGVGGVAGTGFADEDEFLSTGTLKSAGTGATFGAALGGLTPAGIRAFAESGKLIHKSAPRALLQTALKPRPSISQADRSRMVETSLKEGIMPTVRGLRKITDKLNVLDKSLEDIIDTATASGKTIPKSRLFSELKKLRRDLGGAKIDAGTDLNHIDNVAKAFDEQLKAIGKTRLTPTEVQKLKSDAYTRINFDLKQGKTSFAKNEAKKAIARSAKKSLEVLDPNVQGTNQRMSDLLQLNKELGGVSNRIANRNIVSLDTAAKIAAGGASGIPGGTALGVTVSALGAPGVKARTALILENLRKVSEASKITGSLPPELQGAMGVLIGRTQDALNQQIEDLEEE